MEKLIDLYGLEPIVYPECLEVSGFDFTKDYRIWGKKCKIEINFHNYFDEEVTEIQKDTFYNFQNNYDNMLVKAISEVMNYIEDKDELNLSDRTFEDINIFSLIIPKNICIPKKEDRTMYIMFSYRFDMENKIVAKFKNEKFDGIALDFEVL